MNTTALHWYAVFKILSNPLLFISRFAMSQKFYPVSGRNWFTLDTVQLQSNGSTANFLGRRGIYAPAEYSFHCQTVNSFRDALLVPNSTAGNTTEWRLNFIDFQVQVLHLHPVTQYPCSNASSPFIMENVFFFFFSNQVSVKSFMFIGCFLHLILRYRFRASVCPTEQISPTPVTAQVSSLQGFGWDCWPHCSCSTFLCTVCTWSCSWTRWIDLMTLKVHRFQCLSRSEEVTHTKRTHFSVLQCLLINHGLRSPFFFCRFCAVGPFSLNMFVSQIDLLSDIPPRKYSFLNLSTAVFGISLP